MIYVALLRGINVGGKNKVDMKQLKGVFEHAGATSVTTYINSGNVIFSSRGGDRAKLTSRLESAIAVHFGFDVRVLVRDLDEIRAIVGAIEPHWVNDRATMKCDVMFLWEDLDRPDILADLTIKPAVDEVRYVPGAIIWKVDSDKVTRSGMMKLAGSPLYKGMTVRNCNTARRLLELMQSR